MLQMFSLRVHLSPRDDKALPGSKTLGAVVLFVTRRYGHGTDLRR